MEREKVLPRVLLCAPKSGSGKTLITCALLRALVKKGFNPCAFKCGPDFIDPMFHKSVLSVPSRNLDLIMAGEEGVERSLIEGSKGCDIGIIEGVMGFYDGLGVEEGIGSSYDLCVRTKTPAILIVDAKGMSKSVVAMIKGYLEYGSDRVIKGVILNRVSAALVSELSTLIKKDIGIPVIAALPALKDGVLESRHLGLVMPSEVPELLSRVDSVSDELLKSLDMDGLMQIAKGAGAINVPEEKPYPQFDVTVGVARDEAFCFYYEENLELLEKMGARIKFFSPIHDRKIPEISRLIIGGGYPELYAKELSENVSMRDSIKKAADFGIPILAECGGFLYLQEKLKDKEGSEYDMAGALSGSSFMTDKLSHFGYVSVSRALDNPYLMEQDRVRGHEFHYYDTTDNGEAATVTKLSSGRSWSGYQSKGNVFAGFAHLYYPSCRKVIERFLGM
ncbi:cobyrinate a,c-diamide synthase [Butyrivibrio sp. XPD2006]|uniref:cobyrinate a,c-diamide synthase n=1 Tax=Butyrivibrio sp. XPD2006 TaxID=1280668 RepID=UPI0003B7B837|nr:cobyrinate a,c-diamide synthase [Butyrivibrio sp. XPD2006]